MKRMGWLALGLLELSCGGRSEPERNELPVMPEPLGEVRWTQRLPGELQVQALASDDENRIYLGGSIARMQPSGSNHPWLAAWTATGEQLWSNDSSDLSGNNSAIVAMALTNQEQIATASRILNPNAAEDALQQWFDLNGERVDFDYLPGFAPVALATLSNGDVVTAGNRPTDAENAWLVNKSRSADNSWTLNLDDLSLGVVDVAVDGDDRIFVTGLNEEGTPQLLAVSADGALLHDAVETCGLRLAVASDGDLTILGENTQTGLNLRMCRHASDLSQAWSRAENRTGGGVQVSAVAHDRWGNFIAVGSQIQNDSDENDRVEMWTRKYNDNGSLQWDDTLHNDNGSVTTSTAITTDTGGAITVAGIQVDEEKGPVTVVRHLSP